MSIKIDWPEHRSVASEAITDAFNRGLYTDVTVAAEDDSIKCHRIVLSYFSTFFRDVFTKYQTNESNLVVALSLVPAELVKIVISFMYHGTVTIDRSLIPGLRELAKSLGITALMNVSEPPVEQPILASRSSSIIDAAEALQAMRLGIPTNKSTLPNQMAYVNHGSHMTLMNQTARFPQSFPSSFQPTSRQPESQVPGEQPLAGISPASKKEDPMDRDTKFSRYHTSACNNNEPASAISPPLPTRSPNVPFPLKKRKLSDVESFTDDRDVSPNPSCLPHISSGEDDADSRDSDGELQIVESPESQNMEDQSFTEDSEPQDLRVDPKLCPSACARSTIDPATPSVNTIFTAAGNLLSKFSVSSSISRFYAPSSIRDVTILPSHSCKAEVLSNSASSGILEHNSINSSSVANGSHQRRPKVKCSIKRLSPKLLGKKRAENSDKTYTPEQLANSVMAVIQGGLQPVEAINQYGIPRRTFFRRLRIKRTELGIVTKSRSKPSSRSGSPKSMINAPKSIKSPNSPSNSVSVLSSGIIKSVPSSGTELHDMMKKINNSTGSSATLKLEIEDETSSEANSSDFIAANLHVEVKEEVGDVLTA